MKNRHHIIENQTGLSLLVVLIGLLVMSLAAIAVMRKVDTGSLIVGNLAFRNAAVASANSFAENTAIPWISSNSGSLNMSNPDEGYTRALTWGIDSTGNCIDTLNPDCTTSAKIDWNDDECGSCVANNTCTACFEASPAITTNGYTSRFMIARVLGSDGKGPMVKSSSGGECQRTGEITYGAGCGTGATEVPFFRIFVRTVGPRNTVAFIEEYVHF